MAGTTIVTALTIIFLLAFLLLFLKMLSFNALHTQQQQQLIMAKFEEQDLLLMYLRTPAYEKNGQAVPFVELIDEAYHAPQEWNLLKEKTLVFFGQRCFKISIYDKTIEQGSCTTRKLSAVIPSRFTPTQPLVVTLEVEHG